MIEFDPVIIGLLAATGTTIAFLPQVLKSWKSKHTKDISLPMYLIFTTGVFLWLVYGYMISDLPLMLANFITLLLAGSVLFLKLKYG